MGNTILKNIWIGFLIVVVAGRLCLPAVVLADSTTPTPTVTAAPTDTPTPTPTNQTTVNNSASANNTTNSTANTGSNSVNTTPTPSVTVTPTTTPTSTPTPTSSPASNPPATPSATPTIDPPSSSSATITASNSATVTTTGSNTANTGQNNTTSGGGSGSTTTNPSQGSNTHTPTPTPTPTPAITVQTGDAVSVVAGTNTINTTSVNSQMTDQTINIFGDQTGNIDLSTLFQLVNNIISNDKNNDPVINVQVTGVNNYAYLTNTIVSTANTGSNAVGNQSNGNTVVTTGNAESVVSLINKVNLTVVNSSLHLVTINIFGHLTGNIILPNITPLQSTTCSSCGVSFHTENQAVVTNTVNSTANTGSNNITASGSATVTTGNAQSDVNALNIVNQTALDLVLENLFINEFGNWNGRFVGWDGLLPQAAGNVALSSGTPSASEGTPSGTLNTTSITNTAIVNNNISSFANTGGNTVNSSGNTTVTTGTAYSAVSLINLINSNFLNTLGFFGFINIFGNWDGSIGGANEFAALVTPTPTPTPDNQSTSNSSSSSNTQENGGLLSIENSNNVGVYVLPGDTVTFFLKVKNIGAGKVYGGKLTLSLMKDGQTTGSTVFNLGNIPVNRGVKITTGLALSKKAKPGYYTAVATVTGVTGPNSTSISASADSAFTLFGAENLAGSDTLQTEPANNHVQHKVLAAHTSKPTPRSDAILLILLGCSLGSYLLMKGARNRELIQELWSNSSSFKQKLLTIRILLL